MECRSTAHWLNWHCGLSMPAAREQVRVARALERLPLLDDAAAGGCLFEGAGGDRVAAAAIEEMLVELALAGTASQLDRITTAYRRVRREADRTRLRSTPTPKRPRRGRAALESLSTGHDDDGMTVLRAVVVPEDGASSAALASAVEHLRAACNSNAPAEAPDQADGRADKSTRQSRVEALVSWPAHLATNTVAPSVERRHLVMLVDVEGHPTR